MISITNKTSKHSKLFQTKLWMVTLTFVPALVKTILGTSRSKMQQPIAACTRAQSLTRPCNCATCIWLLLPALISAQDGLDPLQLVLVVFILPSISTNTSLVPAVGITCNLHCRCFFFVPTSAFTNVHTWLALLPLPTATCTGAVFPLPTRHLLMCTYAHEHVLQLALCVGGNSCMYIDLHWTEDTF